ISVGGVALGAWPRAAMEASELWVGFVGAGRMAGGLVRGLLQAGKVPASNVLASAPSDKNLAAWRELGCRTTHCNLEVVHRSTLVFLATKPHILPGVLEEIRPAVGPHHIVVSLVAGVTIQTLQRVLDAALPQFPLLEAKTRPPEGRMAWWCDSPSPRGCCDGDAIQAWRGELGKSQISPSWRPGVPQGAAKMLLETGEHPAKLRGDVCTPGGTTIYALHQLEKGALRATVMDAVEAATNRACDMAKD
ncbi:P5CR3 reductase, partial [Prunella himalayana]|nr:P5CR3 reductase [Prunella himalayana]